MKKILLIMSVAILIALFSAPSYVKAKTIVGSAYIKAFTGGSLEDAIVEVYINYDNVTIVSLEVSGNNLYAYGSNYSRYYLFYDYGNIVGNQLWADRTFSLLIPTLRNNISWANGRSYIDTQQFINSLPSNLQPSIAKQRWDAYYEWYKNKYGFYPVEGSLIDMIRKLALGDEDEITEIVFPTLSPTPTSTPTPTQIPVQTIFVPDGNGNTTIIYQYPDPTSGVITQSPYNPNIENNIEINCNCNGGSGSGDNTFGVDPSDPATLTSSMLWADGFGVEISDNPLTAANNSQQSLSDAASEYSDSVNVVSNSFNVLPFKWLTLVGLLGGILIIAGLIRTFLGG